MVKLAKASEDVVERCAVSGYGISMSRAIKPKGAKAVRIEERDARDVPLDTTIHPIPSQSF